MNFLRSIFKRKGTESRDGLIVSFAFSCGGTDYYEVDSIYNLPYQRGRGAVMIYEEIKMKCDYEYLKAYTTAINNLLSGSIGLEQLSKIKNLNNRLSERLNIAFDPDQIYRLASVVYFDKTESPVQYDAEYAKKKIAFWKKNMTVDDFFLQQPLQKLIPFLRSPELNFQSYSEMVATITKIDWEEVLHLLSTDQQRQYFDRKEYFAGETRQNITN